MSIDADARPEPSPGAVTFLATDIAGSTATLRRLGGRYAELLDVHRRLVIGALERHHAVDVGTEGDAVTAVFADALDAVTGGTEAQLAMATHTWPEGERLLIRLGVHSGAAQQRGGEFFGVARDEAARVCGAAGGGQILISDATELLIRERLPAPTETRDLGLHRLKGISTPFHLFQLVHPGLERDFPPLGGSVVHLPHQPTTFVGRSAEMDVLVGELAGDRPVITLVGAGGIGKTRLALQVAATVAPRFGDGVWFVDLAPLTDHGMVVREIARILGVRDVPEVATIDSIIAFLGEKSAVLVIDNVEHVKGASEQLRRIARACPRSRFIVTSREALGLTEDERVVVISPLAARPEAGETGTAPAVQLFLDRARQATPDYAPDEADLTAVASICDRLDGLPLAIELAAARIRVLPTVEILARLEKRLPLLAGGTRDQHARQRALSSTIEWSYELLEQAEAAVFRRLGVFRGGFTTDAVSAVCTTLAGTAAAAILSSLVAKSLVVPLGGERFRLLQTIQDYAVAQLGKHAELDETAERHLSHYLGLAERLAPSLHTGSQMAALTELDQDLDNLRGALAIAEETSGEAMLRLIAALCAYWLLRGLGESRRYIDAAPLDDANLNADLRAGALAMVALVRSLESDLDGAAAALAALDGALPSCTRRQPALSWLRALSAFPLMDRPVKARRLARRGARGLNRHGAAWEAGVGQVILGEVERFTGEVRRSMGRYRRATRLFGRVGDSYWMSIASVNLAECAFHFRDYRAFKRFADRSFEAAKALDNEYVVSYCAIATASLLVESGRYVDAATLLGSALGWLDKQGWREIQPAEQDIASRACRLLRLHLSDEEFDRCLAEGRDLVPSAAVAEFSSRVDMSHDIFGRHGWLRLRQRLASGNSS